MNRIPGVLLFVQGIEEEYSCVWVSSSSPLIQKPTNAKYFNVQLLLLLLMNSSDQSSFDFAVCLLTLIDSITIFHLFLKSNN